jgi:hypothetical protein
LRIEPVFRERCDVLVPEDLDMGIRIGLTERLERWQGENEITDRATADYQNAVNTFPVATALWAVSL